MASARTDNNSPDEWSEGFRDRLSEAMRRARMTQRALAKAVGVEESQVSRWARETVPRGPTIAKIAAALAVSPEWLFGSARPPERPPSPTKGTEAWHELPKVAFTAAGDPVHDLPDSTTWYAFHRSWVERRAKGASEDAQRLVVVQVEKKSLGESMLPGIRPGAILVVDRGPGGEGVAESAFRPGGLYLVRVDDGLTVKRAFVSEANQILTLISDNPDQVRHPPMPVPLRGVRLQSLLVGKIVWIGQEPEVP